MPLWKKYVDLSEVVISLKNDRYPHKEEFMKHYRWMSSNSNLTDKKIINNLYRKYEKFQKKFNKDLCCSICELINETPKMIR